MCILSFSFFLFDIYVPYIYLSLSLELNGCTYLSGTTFPCQGFRLLFYAFFFFLVFLNIACFVVVVYMGVLLDI